VTDANLFLGRLIPEYFPKIFGKTEDLPLDEDASRNGFEKVAEEINKETGRNLELDEIVYGFVFTPPWHSAVS
jgi:5-oxoprolinase (ATP-hydrolysing)